MDKKCCYFIVRGKVQGVWFRASTKKLALQIGVTGWVRNNNDGSVEGVVCGTAPQLTNFNNWLWRGPTSASVEGVTFHDTDFQDLEHFEVR